MVIALIVLTFAPIHFVHPFRVLDYGKWSPALATAWAISTLALLFDLAAPARSILLFISATTAVAIVALGEVRAGARVQSSSRGLRQD